MPKKPKKESCKLNNRRHKIKTYYKEYIELFVLQKTSPPNPIHNLKHFFDYSLTYYTTYIIKFRCYNFKPCKFHVFMLKYYCCQRPFGR